MKGKVEELQGYTKTDLNLKVGGTYKRALPVEKAETIKLNNNNLTTNGIHIDLKAENISDAVDELDERISTKGRVWTKLDIPFDSDVEKITGYTCKKGYVLISCKLKTNKRSRIYRYNPTNNTSSYKDYDGYIVDICAEYEEGLYTYAVLYEVVDTSNVIAKVIRISDTSLPLTVEYTQNVKVVNSSTFELMMNRSFVACTDGFRVYGLAVSNTGETAQTFKVVTDSVDVFGNWGAVRSMTYDGIMPVHKPRISNRGIVDVTFGVCTNYGQPSSAMPMRFKRGGGFPTGGIPAGNIFTSGEPVDRFGRYYYYNNDKQIKCYRAYYSSSAVTISIKSNVDMPVDINGLSVFDIAYIDGKYVYSMVDSADNKAKLWYAIEPFGANRFIDVVPIDPEVVPPLTDFKKCNAFWVARNITGATNIYITK